MKLWICRMEFELSYGDLNFPSMIIESSSRYYLAPAYVSINRVKSPSYKFKPRSIRQSHISIDKVKSTSKKFKVSWMKLLICWMDIWLCRWRFDFVGWSEVWICWREIWLCWMESWAGAEKYLEEDSMIVEDNFETGGKQKSNNMNKNKETSKYETCNVHPVVSIVTKNELLCQSKERVGG